MSTLSGEERSWCEIFGRPSSATTVPPLTPSWERAGRSAVDENKILPLSGIAERNISIGAISKNGELPNSVAESVLGPSTLHENSIMYSGGAATGASAGAGGNSGHHNVTQRGRTSAFSMVQQDSEKQSVNPNDRDCFVPLASTFPSQVTSISETNNHKESTSGIGEFWTRAANSCGVDATVEQLRGCWPNISLDPNPSYNRSISLESKIDPEFKSAAADTLAISKGVSRKASTLASSETFQTDDYSAIKSLEMANPSSMTTKQDGAKKKGGHRRKKSKS